MSRRGVAIVVVVLGAAGAGGAYLLHEHNEPAPTEEVSDASAADAATDARAVKAKGKPGKKPAVRGGKTRVAGHAPAPHGETKPPTAATGAHHHDRPPPIPTGPSGPSYESALGANDEQVTIGSKGPAELTDAQLSAPMSDGTFLGECGAPESMGITVKVAIRGGHAVGVSVDTSPPSPQVNGCIERYVRTLSWPASGKMDSVVTTY